VAPFIYSLSERIDGHPYSDVFASMSVVENSRIYDRLGDYLGVLHSRTFSHFGDVYRQAEDLVVGPAHELDRDATGTLRGPFARWPDMHHEIVNTRLRLMRGTEFEDLIPRIDGYFRERQKVLDCDITPRLLHMDLHRGNMLIRNGQIAGILDVEEAIAGHNEYDLMRTELANFRGHNPGYERAFMDAYTRHVALDDGYVLRKNFYDVSRTLVWIKSLILHGTAYSNYQAEQSSQAARAHLVTLLDVG
jgi:Ser/Thr protein kinase RdoA (MazF antagonist)